MKYEIDCQRIQKGVDVLQSIVEGMVQTKSQEAVVNLDDLTAIAEGYRSAVYGLGDAFSLIESICSKPRALDEEEQDAVRFICEHRDAFQSLMRRCGI